MEYIVNESGVAAMNEQISANIAFLKQVYAGLEEMAAQLPQALGEDAGSMQKTFAAVSHLLEDAERSAKVIHDRTTEYAGKVKEIHVFMS